MLGLFREIEQAMHERLNPTERQDQLIKTYVTEIGNAKLPVVWFQLVRPTFNTKFLIHILLSMGYIKDEYDLFGSPDLRQCFIKAGLLDELNPTMSASNLMKMFVLEQLASIPKGTATFDRYLVAADNTIRDLFVNNQLFSENLPLALYCRVCDNTDDEVIQFSKSKTLNLVGSILKQMQSCGFANIPTLEDCIAADFNNPVAWDPLLIPCGNGQPQESYVEQMQVLTLAKQLIDKYKSAPANYTKGLCHVGAGGVGKTLLLHTELLYGRCQGLKTGMTALNSERAQELATGHIHELFAFQGRGNLSAKEMAEKAIAGLLRNPKKLEYLRTLDVLGLDETGAVPCELLAAMCHVLRYIRGNDSPFGGMLVLSTMDYLQLEPVSGRHPLMSPAFTACFYFRELIHSVRAAADPQWRRIQEFTRMDRHTLGQAGSRQEFIATFVTTCSFVKHLDDPAIPENILFSFGKKNPIREQEQRVIDRITQSDRQFRVSTAIDEEKNPDGNFRPASALTSDDLDKVLKEPRTLILIAGGRYQITYNEQSKFSNSQLAILINLPDQERVDAKLPIAMLVAPPGSRFIPDSTVTQQELLGMGWKEQRVGAPANNKVNNTQGGTRSKRLQYGLRHHVGTTIHGVMGQTLQNLITRVSRGDRSSTYSLWLSSQVVVLLSRTRRGSHTYFWIPGNQTPEAVAEILYDLMCTTSPFRDYLSHLLRQLCNSGPGPGQTYTIDALSIYRPKDIVLPTHELGYVYMLVSTKQLSCVYIGSTKSLVKRWRQHNTGYGANQTRAIQLRPWAILAFIVGFDGNDQNYIQVEENWIARKQTQVRNGVATVESIHNIGKEVTLDFNEAHAAMLRFVSCGTVERIRSAHDDI
jgi:hypothetical protein